MKIRLYDSHVKMQTSKLIPAFSEFLVSWCIWFLFISQSICDYESDLAQQKAKWWPREEKNATINILLECLLEITWHKTIMCGWRIGVEMKLVKREYMFLFCFCFLTRWYIYLMLLKMLCEYFLIIRLYAMLNVLIIMRSVIWH